MKSKFYSFFIAVVLHFVLYNAAAQSLPAGEVRATNIGTINFFPKGDQVGLPIIPLGAAEALELHFDDLNGGVKSYYYTYQLCNADWTPVNLSYMDFIRGFSQTRINQYRQSGGTQSKYTHYQATLPQRNMMPSRSGNYLLKVYENADTSKLLFSQPMLVVDEKSTIAVQLQQPFAQDRFMSHQKVITTLSFKNLDILNPAQEVKVVVLQNFRWDNARLATRPTFIRGKSYEYSNEDQFVFEGGKEWRWLDLRSYRLQSDRVAKVDYNKNPVDVFLRYDTARSPLRYIFYNDMNGRFVTDHLENINPFWQADYGNVHFRFLPASKQQLNGYDVYVYGQLTNYQLTDRYKMQWDENDQAYTSSIPLKNGYYSYAYVTKPTRSTNGTLPSFVYTEGNMWQAENRYTVLVYYRPFGARSDELIGVSEASTLSFFNPAGIR